MEGLIVWKQTMKVPKAGHISPVPQRSDLRAVLDSFPPCCLELLALVHSRQSVSM